MASFRLSLALFSNISHIFIGLGALALALGYCTLELKNPVVFSCFTHHWLLVAIFYIANGSVGLYYACNRCCKAIVTVLQLATIACAMFIIGAILPSLISTWTNSGSTVEDVDSTLIITGFCLGIFCFFVSFSSLLFSSDTVSASISSTCLMSMRSLKNIAAAATLKLLLGGLMLALGYFHSFAGEKYEIPSPVDSKTDLDKMTGHLLLIGALTDGYLLCRKKPSETHQRVAYGLTILTAIFAFASIFTVTKNLQIEVSVSSNFTTFDPGFHRFSIATHATELGTLATAFFLCFLLCSVYLDVSMPLFHPPAKLIPPEPGIKWSKFAECFLWRLNVVFAMIILLISLASLIFPAWIEIRSADSLTALSCLIFCAGWLDSQTSSVEKRGFVSALCFSASFWPFVQIAIQFSATYFSWAESATNIATTIMGVTLMLQLFLSSVLTFFFLFQLEYHHVYRRAQKRILWVGMAGNLILFSAFSGSAVACLLSRGELKWTCGVISPREPALGLLAFVMAIIQARGTGGLSAKITLHLAAVGAAGCALEFARYANELGAFIGASKWDTEASHDVVLYLVLTVSLLVQIGLNLATLLTSHSISQADSQTDTLTKPRPGLALTKRRYMGFVDSTSATLSSQRSSERQSRSNFPAFFNMVRDPNNQTFERGKVAPKESGTQTNLRHLFSNDSFTTLM